MRDGLFFRFFLVVLQSRRLSVGVRQRNGYACINRALTDAYRRMVTDHAAQTRVFLVFVFSHTDHTDVYGGSSFVLKI